MQEQVSNNKNQEIRRAAIMEYLDSKGSLKVTDLSNMLDTSVVTIRKDLDELERQGMLKRVHGGAVKNYMAHHTMPFIDKVNYKRAEKKKIAVAAAGLIQNGDSVIINVGSTSFFVCEELKNKKNLIVITNALQVFNEIGFYQNITTFFLGGRFHPEMQITVGDDVIEQISKYTADKLIMGMDGLDIKAGATSYNHIGDSIMREMINQSKEKILVVDDSKIGKVAFTHIADLEDFNTIVTNHVDKNAPMLHEMERRGLRVITV